MGLRQASSGGLGETRYHVQVTLNLFQGLNLQPKSKTLKRVQGDGLNNNQFFYNRTIFMPASP